MKRHTFDTLSFVSGLLLTLIGLAFLLPRSWGDLTYYLNRFTVWFWPAIFLVIGLAILIPALVPTGKSDDVNQED